MKLLYEWLNEYIDLTNITPEELAEKMSRTGIEVDAVTVRAEGMKEVVVGLVEQLEPHPNSDRLQIAQVTTGESTSRQIVCGATNIQVGQKVIVALPGAVLFDDVTIKDGEIRGVASHGMICSLQELGIPKALVPKEYEEGIYVFTDDTVEVGSDALKALALDSAIVELDLTANRADALSVRGAVHEISAIYGIPHQLDSDRFEVGDSNVLEHWMSVSVENDQHTPAYHLQIIEGVTIQPSPIWMQRRLMAAGIRPINNVVDVTNYILLEYGQPLHAFDYELIGSKEIYVRLAKSGETLTTLDGVERVLDGELVITNGSIPIALAGVMGGLDSEITQQTTTVALETALFDPKLVRYASQKHNLRSESSSRFEKGINRATILQAARRAAELIAQLGGGTVREGIASHQTFTQLSDIQQVVSLRLSRVNHVLGTTLSQTAVEQILAQLGFETQFADDLFTVTIPARRWDITIEADLIEEVGRIYGYNHLPSTLPVMTTTRGQLTDKQRFVRWTREFMQGVGLSQACTYALTTPEKAVWFVEKEQPIVRLDLPMSEERSALRQSLIPSLLEALQYNSARFEKNVRLFEVGRVFSQTEDQTAFIEQDRIGAALTGTWQTSTWQQPVQPLDFYTVKGIIEAYMVELGCSEHITFVATQTIEQMHPSQTATILLNGEAIGFVGKVHPLISKQLDLADTFVFELHVAALLPFFTQAPIIQTVPKFPKTTRDIAVLVPTTVSNDQIVTTIRTNGGPYLTSIQLFDIYEGDRVEEGFKSLAYNLQFVNPERTLQDEEVKRVMEQLTDSLLQIDGLSIR